MPYTLLALALVVPAAITPLIVLFCAVAITTNGMVETADGKY